MKTKLILLASLSLLFSCATKSIVADTSKTVAPAEIKVVQEAAPAQNSVIPETKPIATKVTMLTRELYESKSLYENSCNKCHKLYSPSEFSKANEAEIARGTFYALTRSLEEKFSIMHYMQTILSTKEMDCWE